MKHSPDTLRRYAALTQGMLPIRNNNLFLIVGQLIWMAFFWLMLYELRVAPWLRWLLLAIAFLPVPWALVEWFRPEKHRKSHVLFVGFYALTWSLMFFAGSVVSLTKGWHVPPLKIVTTMAVFYPVFFLLALWSARKKLDFIEEGDERKEKRYQLVFLGGILALVLGFIVFQKQFFPRAQVSAGLIAAVFGTYFWFSGAVGVGFAYFVARKAGGQKSGGE